jgi:long-subunit acyl-CoA synthetase (AMP-forming)
VQLDPGSCSAAEGPAAQCPAVERAPARGDERFARTEQVKRFAVLVHDLTQAAGELTPASKVKRPVMQERYAAEVDRLYRRAAR